MVSAQGPPVDFPAVSGTEEQAQDDPGEDPAARFDAAFERAQDAMAAALRLHGQGRDVEASEAAALASEHFAELELPLAEARMLRLRADCLLGSAQPDEATEVAQLAGERFAKLEEATPADHAGVEAVLGAADRLRGAFPDARACRVGVAVVLHAEGELGPAITMLTELRSALLENRWADAVATCDFDLGVALHDLGELDDAVEYLQQARATFATLGRSADAAACNQNIGVALQAMGRPEEALPRLRDARAAFSSLGRNRDAAQCDHNLAVVMRSLGDEVGADRLEAQALAAEAVDAP